MKRNKNAKARTILDRSLKVRGKGFLSTTTTPTMLDDQLTNGQHKSICRKNNFSSSFHPSSKSRPILPSPILSFHRSQTLIQHLPRIPLLLCRSPFPLCKVPLSFCKTNIMLTKKGTTVTKKKLFRPCSLLASDSSFTDRRCVPGGLSNDKNSLPEAIAIRSACPINSFV